MNGDKLVYNVTEVAEALGVSRPTVYELLNTPGFPAFRIGNRWLTSKAGLSEWVEKQCAPTELFPFTEGRRYG